MKGSIFSESWFKVAELKVSINSNNHIKKQIYRGEVWYVIEDSFNDQFFKIKPPAYEFISRLDHNKTVEEVWEECLELLVVAPSQDEVISLLSSLHHKNLLYFKNRADNEQLVERASKRKISEIKGKLFSFLYVKIPLIDPDNWLNMMKPFINIVFSKFGFIVWLITLLFGLKLMVENFSLLSDETQGMLAPGNLFLLYISILGLKMLHELGHAMIVKKFGGRVNTMGIMILVMTPIPFMDATQSWLFRSKYERALVGAGGMIVELFFASVAMMIWANTGEGIIHSVSFNIMFIGSVSSLFFNGNPLLRFDSYFILSDILEIPNLYEQSKKQWYYFVEKYIFRLKELTPPSHFYLESFWLYSYGVLSFLYRLFIALLIAIFVGDQWFAVGVLVVIITIYMWIVKPQYSFIKYLFKNEKLYKTRYRTVFISGSFMTLLIFLFAIIPFPFSLKANGIVLANNYSTLFVKSEGYLSHLRIENGKLVKKGEILASIVNEELSFEIETIHSSLKETEAYILNARTNAKADLKPIFTHKKLLEDKLIFLEKQKAKLEIVAESEGYFIYDEIEYKTDTWLKLGAKIGTIIPLGDVHFEAVVPQESSYSLFQQKNLTATIKLYGQSKKIVEVKSLQIIPFEKQELPSAALGWLGGGNIATSSQDSTGRKTRESFFEVRAEILKNHQDFFLHGRSGILKIELEPLTFLQRSQMFLTQLLQKHYKI